MHSPSKPCRLIEEDKKNHDQQKKLATSTKKGGSPLLLCICASGICSCYLYFGMIQEKLFSKGSVIQESGVGNVTTFMLVLSCITNVMVAFLWTWIQDRFFTRSHHHDDGVVKKKKVDSSSVGDNDAGGELLEERKSRCHDRPLHHVMLLANAFTYFAAMTASNEALGYVSYPTAVLAKSSKLIPTMIVGSLVERKLFKLQDWCSALLITGGIAIFNLSRLSSKKNHHVVKPSHDVDDDSSDSDSIFGIFLLILSLAMDGLLSSCQESLKQTNNHKGKKYRIPSALESMLWVNAYAILFMLPLSLCNGQFANGCKLLSMGLLSHTTRKTPSLHADSPESFSLTWSIVLLNLTAAAGQIFIFFTIALFSPLTCTTITTTRKFCTILLSVWKFGHVVTPLQWMAIGMVFGGIYLAILSKFTSSSKTKKNKAKKEVVCSSLSAIISSSGKDKSD